MKKLSLSFYQRKDVVTIAKDLIGKIVVTNIDGKITSGRIVETEAYVAHIDKASHAYKGKRTLRNEAMYAAAGTVYVYICYGLHNMLNIVTNDINVPDAILIRALEPIDGIDTMLERTNKKILDNTLTKGPGNVAKAMGVSKNISGLLLGKEQINILKNNFIIPEKEIGMSKRIGIDNAGEDALLPYRFYLKGNRFVSGKPVK